MLALRVYCTTARTWICVAIANVYKSHKFWVCSFSSYVNCHCKKSIACLQPNRQTKNRELALSPFRNKRRPEVLGLLDILCWHAALCGLLTCVWIQASDIRRRGTSLASTRYVDMGRGRSKLQTKTETLADTPSLVWALTGAGTVNWTAAANFGLSVL